MKLTDLQILVLGKMRLDLPMTGDELRGRVGYLGSNRAWAAVLIRMRDRGLIDAVSMEPIKFAPTDKGVGAYSDVRRSLSSPKQPEGK